MEPRILFWSLALANMWLVVALGLVALRSARKGDMGGFDRWMLGSAVLVVLFVLAYGAKLLALGREDLDAWGTPWVVLLRVHQVFIVLMLVAGIRAAVLRWRAAGQRAAGLAGTYARSGRLAVLAAGLGACAATVLLAGMFLRA